MVRPHSSLKGFARRGRRVGSEWLPDGREAHKERPLQRYFSTFPGGWPAVGLLLLRAVAGGAAAGQGASYLWQGEPTVAGWSLGAIAIVSGVGLVAGFLTPGAATVAGLTTLLMATTSTPPLLGGLMLDARATGLLIADAVALAMLGPGAHSIDAYRFGRREIVISTNGRIS